MSTAAIFNKLGQTIMPRVASIAFPDTMNITGETTSQGTGGGQVKSAASAVYSNVPVSYAPTNRNSQQKTQAGDRLVSVQQYLLTFPTHQSGSRLNVDVKKHRLVVQARGNELAKTFRIISLRDTSGVIFEAVCEKEN